MPVEYDEFSRASARIASVKVCAGLGILLCACSFLKSPKKPERQQCEVHLAYVTPTDYVWIEGNRETVVTLEVAAQKLIETPAFERRTGTGLGECTTGQVFPIVWRADLDGRKTKARDRALSLWARVRDEGVVLPKPDRRYHDSSKRRNPPYLYRSHEELGENAFLVPKSFDFSKRWLMRAFFPSGKMREMCSRPRDSYMTQTEEERQREAEEKTIAYHEEQRGLYGPAARIARATLYYNYQGTLEVIGSRGRETRDPKTNCLWVETSEPVLVAIPQTRLNFVLVSQ